MQPLGVREDRLDALQLEVIEELERRGIAVGIARGLDSSEVQPIWELEL